MPLSLTVSCSSKSRLVLTLLVVPFWYLLTRVVPDKFQKSSKTVVCVCFVHTDLYLKTITITRNCTYNCFCTNIHRHSSTPNLRIANLITSVGTLSKAFSKSTKPKQSFFPLALNFSCIYNHTHTHTHTTIFQLSGLCLGKPG